jgi:hypothetical protein
MRLSCISRTGRLRSCVCSLAFSIISSFLQRSLSRSPINSGYATAKKVHNKMRSWTFLEKEKKEKRNYGLSLKVEVKIRLQQLQGVIVLSKNSSSQVLFDQPSSKDHKDFVIFDLGSPVPYNPALPKLTRDNIMTMTMKMLLYFLLQLSPVLQGTVQTLLLFPYLVYSWWVSRLSCPGRPLILY